MDEFHILADSSILPIMLKVPFGLLKCNGAPAAQAIGHAL